MYRLARREKCNDSCTDKLEGKTVTKVTGKSNKLARREETNDSCTDQPIEKYHTVVYHRPTRSEE